MPRSVNVLCTKFTNVFYDEIDKFKFVNAYNYFHTNIVDTQWSSSLSMRCQDSIAQCIHFLVFRAYTHMICRSYTCIFNGTQYIGS